MKGRYEFESEESYNEYLITYFAGMALQGYLASHAQEGWENTDADARHAAKISVLYANELVKALKSEIRR